MISIAEQLARVLAGVNPLGTEVVGLGAALGRTLAADVTATIDIPVFDNSAMDGYAVRYDDVASASPQNPVTLTVTGDVPAGSDLDPAIAPGTTVRIMTGAPMPSEADAVVQLEHTDEGTDVVVITTAPAPAAHIRRAGGDLRVGDRVLAAGDLLSPRHVSAASAAGHPELTVYARARVAIIATGSELRPPGEPLARGQIPESNTVLLAGLATQAGADVVAAITVDDTEDALRDQLTALEGDDVDLVILSGGVSVGAYDVTKAVLAPMGTVTFTPVAMQPGKPQAFGHLPGGTPVFGLPGNPVSACVSFEAFVAPALARMHGRTRVHAATQDARVSRGWRTPAGRAQYMPVAVEYFHEPTPPTEGAVVPSTTSLHVRPATSGGAGSHLVGGLAAADAFAIIPADVHEVREGDIVAIMMVQP